MVSGVVFKHIVGGGSSLELVTQTIYQDIVFKDGKSYEAKVPEGDQALFWQKVIGKPLADFVTSVDF